MGLPAKESISFPNKFSSERTTGITGNIVKCGEISKKNRHGRKKYSKRYFKLKKRGQNHFSPVLDYCYTNNKTSKTKGSILLDGCDVVKTGGKKFEINHPERESRFFQVDDELECDDWVESIKKTLSGYEDDCVEEEKVDVTAKSRRRSSIQVAVKQAHWSDDDDYGLD